MTYKEFITDSIDELSDLYSYSEAKAISVRILTHVLDIIEYEYIVEPNTIIPKSFRDKLIASRQELSEGKPIQYVLGYEYFAGHKFILNEHVLIPRPETEELFRLIVEENKNLAYNSIRIFDVCTGSGVLAHSLAAFFKNSEVFACDISQDALKVAEGQQIFIDESGRVKSENRPHFFQCDILDSLPDVEEIDILVSNPPYVLESEKDFMRPNVLEYEPHIALFVPDSDPLRYYAALSDIASNSLKSGGVAYFEINESFSSEIRTFFESKGFSNVEILTDIYGKYRFVKFVKWF